MEAVGRNSHVIWKGYISMKLDFVTFFLKCSIYMENPTLL